MNTDNRLPSDRASCCGTYTKFINPDNVAAKTDSTSSFEKNECTSGNTPKKSLTTKNRKKLKQKKKKKKKKKNQL